MRACGSTVLVATILAATSGSLATAVARAPGRDDGPRLLKVKYEAVPDGPNVLWGLSLRTFDADGRVYKVDVFQLDPARGRVGETDIGCVESQRNGVIHTLFAPMTLAPGVYRMRVTLYSATCDSFDPRPQWRRVFRTVRVPAPPTA